MPQVRCKLCKSFTSLGKECKRCQALSEGIPETGPPEKTPEQKLETDRRVRQLESEARELKLKYKHALENIEQLESSLSTASVLQNALRDQPKAIIPPAMIQRDVADALALASDWHLGKVVKPQTVNGLNEFNEAIARERAHYYFVNLVKQIKEFRHGNTIEHLVLWLGGDLINNWLREEDVEMNAMAPMMELLFVQEVLISGINYLLKEGNLKQITIVCNDGNHGRLPFQRKTKKGTRTDNSLEILLYHNLAKRFQNDPAIKWQIATGEFNYLKVYGKLIRFYHGDGVKYHGGVGGITIPPLKAINRYNDQVRADLDVMGHWHMLTWHPKFTINGSLVGIDPYGISIGGSPERPQQSFQLISAKHGFTLRCPILLEEV